MTAREARPPGTNAEPAGRPETGGRRYRRWDIGLGVVLAVVLALTAWAANRFFEVRLGPEQPIPFSHRVHTHVKGISCFICHPGAASGDRAGVPPLETCMLCHERVIIHYPYIEKLREHYAAGRPVVWRRVNELPEFVYFPHAVHLHRSVDCGHCHGDVHSMDRIEQAHEFKMGFCVQCHRDHKVTVDCFTCHR